MFGFFSAEHLRRAFSQYGTIVSVAINRDKNGAPRGFGFMEFDTPHAVRTASVSRNVVNSAEVALRVCLLRCAAYVWLIRPPFKQSRSESNADCKKKDSRHVIARLWLM